LKRLCNGLIVLLTLAVAPVAADELIMVRAEQSFPEAMNDLQKAIKDHGYTVARVQRVDVGLTAKGYKTAEYRVVFFGKLEETRALYEKHPELLPYLPLKITLFAEGDSSLAVTNSPIVLSTFFRDPALRIQFIRWERDVRSILDQLASP
jgi:uncharacterized protein (DUF302 family)